MTMPWTGPSLSPPDRPSGRPPGRPRTPVWVRVLVTVAVLAVVALVGFGAVVAVGMSGGLDDVLDLDKPREDDARVVAARDEARDAHAEDLAALAATARSTGLDGTVLAQAWESSCREGLHDWKVDDDFDLSCTRTDEAVLTAGPREGFVPQMRALDTALSAAGWVPDDVDGIGNLLAQYEAREAADGPGAVSLQDLGVAEYRRGTDVLRLRWFEPGLLQGDPFAGYRRWTAPDGADMTYDDIVGAVPSGGYAMTAERETLYFHE